MLPKNGSTALTIVSFGQYGGGRGIINGSLAFCPLHYYHELKRMDGLYMNMGSYVDKKTSFHFLDEMSLTAIQLVLLSRLKINTRIFVDQQLTRPW